MKKTVPFEFFGGNQTIYFDITRLALLEQAMGVSVTVIGVGGHGVGLVDLCLKALPIGLAHHNPGKGEKFYSEAIEAYLERPETRGIEELAVPIIRAIYASGVFGKESQKRALGDENTGKND